MPDLNIYKDPKPVVSTPSIPQSSAQNAEGSGKVDLPISAAPNWIRGQVSEVPYRTQLDKTLRYTDTNLGYNPFDTMLEDKYAKEHYIKTFGNNVLKGLAKTGGTFIEAFATIPLAINATSNNDFSKLYDNNLTNSLQDWYDSLENSLPTYRTQNEEDHPFLSWFNSPLGLFQHIGGAINNLGFTAGAILGTIAEGAVITAMTGGTGTLPAVGANLTRFFGKFGRAVAASAESAAEVGKIAKVTLQNAEEVKLLENVGAHQMGGTWKKLATSERGVLAPERGIARTAEEAAQSGQKLLGEGVAAQEMGVARYTGRGLENEFSAGTNSSKSAFVNKIDKSLNTLFKVTKIGDSVKYNLSLLTSAMAEGSFEANSVMRTTDQSARKAFFDANGHDATGEELIKIKELSVDAGNFTMGANIAILYASNRLNWGSLFKPTKATISSEIDKGLFHKVFNRYTKVLDKETGLYKMLDNTPTSKLGKLLSYGVAPTRAIRQSLIESAEEGAQFTVSEGAADYASRKYDGKNRGEFADYIKSFNYGVGRTFQSNEGWENLIGGFVGGIFGGFLARGGNALRGVKHQNAKARLQSQIDGLNQQTFKGLFMHAIDGAVASQSIEKEYQKAVKSGDIFAAKNLKAKQFGNWVSTAVKLNSFDARMDEIQAAKDLKGEEFTKMWGGLEYNEENRSEAVDYLNKVQEKAKAVKNDIEKVDRLFRGNPFSAKTQPADYSAHESWKDELAINLGLSRDYQQRSKQLQEDIARVLPGMSIDNAIKLTSKKGISDILQKMSTAMDNLAKSESDARAVDSDLAYDYKRKHAALREVFNEMQQHIIDGFDAKKFIPTLRKMYDIFNGTMESNKYLEGQKQLPEPGVVYIKENEQAKTDDEVVDVFERLQDMTKLHNMNYNAISAYDNLLKPRGYKGYINYAKGLMNRVNEGIKFENGIVETPVDIERKAEEQAKEETAFMPEEDGITKEQREAMNDMIMREAAGEELSPEEKEILDEHPLFVEKVKTTEAKKAAILKEQGVVQNLATDDKKPVNQVTEYTTDESGFRKEVSPVELLNKINSHEKVGKDANKNLFKAIFSKINNFLQSNITVKLAKSDFAIEREKNGNVKQKYEAITLFDKDGKKVGVSGIFKSRYERNLEIYHNGEFVGLMKPADSLFLDEEGKRTIYEMKESEFTNVTGMPKSEYKAYMKELNAYKKAHDALLAEFNGSTTEKRSGLNGIDEIIFSNPNFKLEGFNIDGNYWNVVTSTDRAKVLVNINGVVTPFYLTTGQGGKDLKPGWYPFFGVGKDGWLNKTDKSDMETYYERYWGKEAASVIQSISEELNNFYGTEASVFKNDGDPNETLRPLTTLADKVEDYINSKLPFTPAINDSNARINLRSNVEKLGKEIVAKYNEKLTASSKATDVVGNDIVTKLFPEIRVNIGNAVFNKSTDKEKDTLIKDLQYKPTGTSLISYKYENGIRKATIVNEQELSRQNPSYYNKLKAFIASDSFKAQAQGTEGRYMLAIPVNGEYTTKALIFSRPAEINTEKKDRLVSLLKDNLGKELNPVALDEINSEIHSVYYIANADRSVKGTTIDLMLNEDGSMSLHIKNNEKGTAYNNILNAKDVKITDYDSVIKTIQEAINDNERLDPNLQKLKIAIKDDSIKFQTLNDNEVYGMKDVEDKIKVATTPKVFENFSVNMYPKGSTKGEIKEPKAPTAPKGGDGVDIDTEDGTVAEPIVKTPEQIEEAKKTAAQQAFEQIIDEEYTAKKLALHDSFINNLTPAEKKIKDFLKNNPTFVGKEIVEVYNDIAKGADVTANDVSTYLVSVRAHNIQRAKLDDIAASKKQSDIKGSTSEAIMSKSSAETSIILQDLFGLSKEQADANASIFERNRQAWVQDMYNKEQQYRTDNKGYGSAAYAIAISPKELTKLQTQLTAAKEKLDMRTDSSTAKINDLNKIISDEKSKEKDINKAITDKANEEAVLKGLKDDVDILQSKLDNPTKTLYGADLLDFINAQSYSRFGFGKKTEAELGAETLKQDISVDELKTALKENKILKLNCK